jgi:hypothetical protein
MGELTPVFEIDGRVIGDKDVNDFPMTKKLQNNFNLLTKH